MGVSITDPNLPVAVCFMFTIFAVLFQKTLQLRREVDIAVTGAGFWLLDDDFFSRELDDIAADMNGTLTVVDVAPFQAAAFAAPHPRCNEQFEICFVLLFCLSHDTDLVAVFVHILAGRPFAGAFAFQIPETRDVNHTVLRGRCFGWLRLNSLRFLGF